MRTILLSLLLSTALCAGFASQAGAAIIQLGANVDGATANAGAGTGSTATGTISLTLDDVTNELTWSGSFSGLLGDYAISHFHGPALANQNAGVQIATAVVLDPGNRSGTSNGVAILTAGQAADLVNGLWYWNVHSQFALGGEIRGNIGVVPEPGTALLMMLGLVGLRVARPATRASKGTI